MAVVALTASGDVELDAAYTSAADVLETVRQEAETAGSLTGSAFSQPPPRVLLGTADGGTVAWADVIGLTER